MFCLFHLHQVRKHSQPFPANWLLSHVHLDAAVSRPTLLIQHPLTALVPYSFLQSREGWYTESLRGDILMWYHLAVRIPIWVLIAKCPITRASLHFHHSVPSFHCLNIWSKMWITTLVACDVAVLRANLCLGACGLAYSGGSANNHVLSISFVKFQSPFL